MKYHPYLRHFLFMALLLSSFGLFAQYRQPYFNTISVENGLPEGNILNTLEDHRGYLWLATQNGLMRYDGYSLKRYEIPDAEGKPIISPSARALFEDSQKKLWILVGDEGLYYLDRQENAFSRIALDSVSQRLLKDNFVFGWVKDQHQPKFFFIAYHGSTNKTNILAFDPNHETLSAYSASGEGAHQIPSSDIVQMATDKAGQIWMITDSLLHKYNSASLTFDPWFALPDSLKEIKFFDLVTDPLDQDILWINTTYLDQNPKKPESRGFFQYNTRTKTYKTFKHSPTDPASITGDCRAILVDSLKRLWFATENGISLFNPSQGTFTNYPLNIPLSISGEKTFIRTIASDPVGNLWMGGFFRGLLFLDIKTGQAIYHEHNKRDGSLPDHSGISKIFFDRSHTLWINMPYTGIASLDRQRSILNPIPIHPPSQKTNTRNASDNFYPMGTYKDSLLFVKGNNEIAIWNPIQNTYERIELPDLKISGHVEYGYAGKDGSIWIATNNAGLYHYNPKRKLIKAYLHDPKDSTSISSNSISVVIEDREGQLYIGTNDKGICKYNKETGTFTRYPFNDIFRSIKTENGLDDRSAISLMVDSKGNLWIGTNLGGLNRLDSRTGKFTSYYNGKTGLTCVTNIFEDRQHRIWAGTYLSGIFLIDPETGSYTRFSEKDGLLHNFNLGIREDAEENLWIATPKGFSKLDPTRRQFTNFPMPVKVAGYFSNMLHNGIGQELFVMMAGGLIAFDPASLGANTTPPEVVIESIRYPVHRSSSHTRDTILFLTGNENIRLAHHENKIGFEYVALHFADPEANQYAYQLEGYDDGWIAGGNQRSVTYTNLSPGIYTFHVKASNSDGIWNEEGTSVTITILPPWWKTWWAYILYALIFLGALRIFSKWRERNLRTKNELLERKVEERTNSLKTTLDHLKSTQAQLIQSEKMASLGELTAGIAHEIQNPLNFINNFAEVNAELIDELKEGIETQNLAEVKSIAGNIRDNEEKIIFHGKRADAIVKGMLQHSRSSSGQKEPTDINALTDEYLRLAYHGLRAKDKSFNATMITDYDDSIGMINVIPQDIGRVILNLITNAFYAVSNKTPYPQNSSAPWPPEGGKNYVPTITIATRKFLPPLGGQGVEREPGVTISVSDNGPGIPAHILDKIFQPFFTTKPTGQGTGLGLSLSYDIVKAHGGELKVKTREGEGSVFIIELPIG